MNDQGPAFYKNGNGELLAAPIGVDCKALGLHLNRDEPETKVGSHYGWQWFESELEARQAYGLPEPDPAD
jgi:hypothetical protein